MNWSHTPRHQTQMFWLALGKEERKPTWKHGGIGMQKNRPNITAQGKCLAVLARAGHVVHVGKSGT